MGIIWCGFGLFFCFQRPWSETPVFGERVPSELQPRSWTFVVGQCVWMFLCLVLLTFCQTVSWYWMVVLGSLVRRISESDGSKHPLWRVFVSSHATA